MQSKEELVSLQFKADPPPELFAHLVGEWDIRTTHPNFPGICTGRVSFRVSDEGAFLTMRSEIVQPGPPSSVAVFGYDDSFKNYSMIYFDVRKVARVYGMSLADGIWKIWRDAPGFFQRFEGKFNDNRSAIKGLWQLSEDSSDWKDDLKIDYTKRK